MHGPSPTSNFGGTVPQAPKSPPMKCLESSHQWRSRAWTKVDGVHTLLCRPTKIHFLYFMYTFVTLQTSDVHSLLMASTHFFLITTPLPPTSSPHFIFRTMPLVTYIPDCEIAVH